MTFTLRPYQTDLVDRTRAALARHKSVLVQLATGGGKTGLASFMLGRAAERGKRSVFTVHRQELLEQTQKTFAEFGIPCGVVAPGHYPRPHELVQIASIDTLRSRLKRGKPVPPADMLVVDEAHHLAAPTWQFVKGSYAEKNAGIRTIGLSASPERRDGKGLDDQFDVMVEGPSVRWLMDNGFLADYRAFAPSAPDLSGVHTVKGDYDKAEAEAAMDKSSITGDAIDHYIRHARGRKFIAFCVSIKHSLHTMEQFRAAGVACWHVDGETDRAERKMAMDDFRRGDLQGLLNVDLFGEGLDVPDAEVMIGLRPTKSLALFLQQCGRVLRPQPGKTALILDHGSNLARHGLVDDERHWSLQGRKARKKIEEDAEDNVQTRQCPACFYVHRPAPSCPACGHVYEAQPREVEERAGELVEIDKERMRHAMKEETRNARTEEALTALGRSRGYANPEGWARVQVRIREEYRAKFAKRRA